MPATNLLRPCDVGRGPSRPHWILEGVGFLVLAEGCANQTAFAFPPQCQALLQVDDAVLLIQTVEVGNHPVFFPTIHCTRG